MLQNSQKTFLAGVIILFSIHLNAQIEKGTTNLGVFANFSKASNSYGQDYVITNENIRNINFTPSYGQFITDKIMVKGLLETSFYKKSQDFVQNDYTHLKLGEGLFPTKNINLKTEARYYFNPKKNWKLFSGATLGWEHTYSKYILSYFYANPTPFYANYSSKEQAFNYSLFVGADKFLNSEIAIEGILSYNHHSTNPKSDIGLNIGLNNFMKYTLINKDLVGLINKGRSIISGNISFNRYLSDIKKGDKSTQIDIEFGKFVTKGLLLGIKANMFHYRQQGDYDYSTLSKEVSIAHYVQYYYPITNRLMAQAKIEAKTVLRSNDKINNNNAHSDLSLNGSIGTTYFLSKYVALNLDVVVYRNQLYSDSHLLDYPNNSYLIDKKTFNSNIGLRFFLK
jgi:hypothetical protein